MRNRWYHRPLLHQVSIHPPKKVTWLELFYDLIFVAAIIQLGDGLSKDVSLSGAFSFAAMFVPLWTAWTGFTFFENRFTVDDFLHRALVFFQMLAVGAMAVTAADVLKGDVSSFSLSAALALAMIGVLYTRAYFQQAQGRDYSVYWGSVFLASAACFFIAAFVPNVIAFVLWALSATVILISPTLRISKSLAERFPTDQEHLSERFGLLTIIVLGESFVKVLSSMSASGEGLSFWFRAATVLAITCSLWWVYFDDIAESKIRIKQRGAWVTWLYGHIPLQIGITAVGVAVKKSIGFDTLLPAAESYRWLLCSALALTLLSVALLDSVTDRHQAELSDRSRVSARVVGAVLILLMAPAASSLSGLWFLVIVTLLTVSQVIFDMVMAPVEAVEHEHHATLLSETVKKEGPKEGNKGKRRDISEAVRLGVPSALRRDMYYYFMDGSWMRLILWMGVLFILSNLFFALLYLLEAGTIANAKPGSFADAFFFSVQTMSTIGFGTLAPTSFYGHMVVTLEAAVGILGVALATGLMFARASRPQSSTLFSQNILITPIDGIPTLNFRVGNARGNEIVGASMSLSALTETITQEGQHIRRIVDLPLIRNSTPLFALSWSIMHPVDKESPIQDLLKDETDSAVIGFIATLIGHDGTYGQTTYSRHTYYIEDLVKDATFIDIISQFDDGRLLIDYHGFHRWQKNPKPTA